MKMFSQTSDLNGKRLNKTMIYFLYGPDRYRLLTKVREITHRYQAIHSGVTNPVEIEGEGISFARLKDIYQQPSMFVKHRLVIIRNIFQTPAIFQTKLQKEMANLSQSSTIFLFYQVGPIKNHKRLLESLKKYARVQEFSSLPPRGILIWLTQEANRYSLVLQPEACSCLANLIHSDLWKGHLALEKIAAYLGGEKKEVDVETVEKLIETTNAINVFAMVNALQNNQLSKALSAVNSYLDQGGAVELIIGQLNSFLIHLLTIRILLDEGKNQTQIKQEVTFNPWAVSHLIGPAQRFSREDINAKIQYLFKTDIGLKTGRIERREAINDFLLRFEDLTKR